MSTAAAARGSGLAAWWWLVVLSFRRLWWTWHTVAAVLLLGAVATMVLGVSFWRLHQRGEWGWSAIGFSKTVLLGLYLGFLLPLLSLAFATQTLGGEWEDRTLVWVLTRPLARPWVYLAKFVAAAPWTFGLTMGGWFLLGALGGPRAFMAAASFWPAAALGTLAYLCLFQLLGAAFRRSTIIGVAYAFVLETLIGNMPGMVKRASIAFYARSLVYDLAVQVGLDQPAGDHRTGVVPDKAFFFLPVDGGTAIVVLLAASLALFLIGVVVFSRREYRELT
jgi:ABC-type transport system involved in multi-copper enzyme maturation permease subunit